jgi:hypothetical protein
VAVLFAKALLSSIERVEGKYSMTLLSAFILENKKDRLSSIVLV